MKHDVPPNQFRHVDQIDAPATYRDGRWHTFEPRAPVEMRLRGEVWRLRPGLTFTPYANPTRCNASCAFCSEELKRRDASRLTAEWVIDDHQRYFSALNRAWSELRGFSMGLSLSGLEATTDPQWLLALLDLVRQHDALLSTRVLYTNGSGLVRHPHLVDALAETQFDRIELSRCHFDADINQQIMRFRRGEPIWRREAFEELLPTLNQRIPVKLSCILNKIGVCSVEDVEAYIEQARALGVEQVVFRELSALGDAYEMNRTHRWIDEHRVSVRGLMDVVWPSGTKPRQGWTLQGVTSGYYYYNEVYLYRGVRVILEASSYTAHHTAVQSGVLQKLVFHSNGDLCGDWVPNAMVIGNYHT